MQIQGSVLHGGSWSDGSDVCRSRGVARVNFLATGAIKAMTHRALPPASFLLLSACGAISATLAWYSQPPLLAEPPEQKLLGLVIPPDVAPLPRAAEKPLIKGPNRILFHRDSTPDLPQREDGVYLLDPDGKNEKKIHDIASPFTMWAAQLSPDGKRIAAQLREKAKLGDDSERAYLHVRELDEKEPGTHLNVSPDFYVWSHDGTELACSEYDDNGDDKPLGTTHYIVNVKTKQKSTLKLPSGHVIAGWTPDGKYFLTDHRDITPKPFGRVYLMNRDGTVHKALTDEKQRSICGRLSPDGGRVLYAVITSPPEARAIHQRADMVILDIASGKATKVQDVPLNAQLHDFCWSPDGKQIAYIWRRVNEADTDENAVAKETEMHLIVCDTNGGNAKTIFTMKCTGYGLPISGLNWR